MARCDDAFGEPKCGRNECTTYPYIQLVSSFRLWPRWTVSGVSPRKSALNKDARASVGLF
jgi:hypothetical protein